MTDQRIAEGIQKYTDELYSDCVQAILENDMRYVMHPADVLWMVDKIRELESENKLLREALRDMRFAYINKDADCPHGFETAALAKAEAIIGPLPAPCGKDGEGE